jgi:Secretion system C-terminal sorting domain
VSKRLPALSILMMKNFFLLFFLCAVSTLSAQNERADWVWTLGYDYFGDSVGIDAVTFDFRGVANGDTMKITYGLQDFEMNRPNASLCDTNGNLLVYTNGCAFGDGNRKIISASDTINLTNAHRVACADNDGLGGSRTVLLLPDNYNRKKKHLICQPITIFDFGLRCDSLMYNRFEIENDSIKIDMNDRVLYTGAMDEITDSSVLFQHLSACLHGNGKDWWIIHPFNNSKTFSTYRIGKEKIELELEQNIAKFPFSTRENATGNSVFSPDGTKYVLYSITSDVQIFNFDRCTGVLSNPIHIAIQDSADTRYGAGCAISNNSRYLYVASTFHIYQFDLLASNIEASKTTVAYWDGYVDEDPLFRLLFNQAQLAPDNKIYVTSTGGRTNFHVIEYPDSAGLACKVVQHKQMLKTAISSGLPNFPYFRLGKWTGSPCDTIKSVSTTLPEEQSAYFMLRPNPANSYTVADLFVQSVSIDQPLTLEVYSIAGQTLNSSLLSHQTTMHRIETESLPNGVYFVSLKQGGRILRTEKLVVLRE